jgi:GDP-6-deoxy-D-talose 4-dehydrogenase
MVYYSKNKVLITGIDSFTGRYMKSRLIDTGYEVYGTVHSLKRGFKNDLVCDISHKDKIDEIIKKVQPHFVIHLAAISYVPKGTDLSVYQTNLFGTLNLLGAINKYATNISKIIISSSAAIYGDNSSLIDEHSAANPINHYGFSKLVMEKMALIEFKNKLPLIFVRSFNYTGIDQSQQFLIPKLIDAFKKNEKVIQLGNISVSKDFSDVRDVVRAYEVILASQVYTGTYNVCSGRSISVKKIISYLEEISGKSIEIQKNSSLIRKNEIKYLKGNGTKIRKLGWAPEFDIRDTLEWMFTAIK